MLALPYRQFLRRTKLRWACVTAGVLFFAQWMVNGFLNEKAPVLCAGLSTAVAAYILFLYVGFLVQKPEPLHVVLDRRLSLPPDSPETPPAGQ